VKTRKRESLKQTGNDRVGVRAKLEWARPIHEVSGKLTKKKGKGGERIKSHFVYP